MLLASSDSKYLFSVNGTRLNVYSVASGEILYRLYYAETSQYTGSSSISKPEKIGNSNNNNNESLIRSICINPMNKFQLFSFHSNGRVCLWDYEDGLLLKAYETKLNIKKALRVQSSVYIVGSIKSSLSPTTPPSGLSLYKLMISSSLKNKVDLEHFLVVPDLSLNQKKLQIDINYDEKYAAYIEGKKRLVITQFKSNNPVKKFTIDQEMTCLAMHPSEDCIAVGTSSGKIILWYNYLSHLNSSEMMTLDDDEDMDDKDGLSVRQTLKKKKSLLKLNDNKPTKTVLHWHSLPVLSLAFSPEGSYLLSGGHECVLVKWLFKTGQNYFKPRLGAPIDYIVSSADNTLYTTRHLDNTIHVMATNLDIVQTFGGFLCANFSAQNAKMIADPNYTLFPAGLTHFGRLSCLIANGKPGHLQFYSIKSEKLLFNLDIVEENYISPENLNRPNVHTEIETLAFNHDQTWLATVERRDDGQTTPEIKLKFWRFDQTNAKFTLNTLVRYPHSFEKVNTLKFKPGGAGNVLFTTGNDGCFKSWTLVENKLQADSKESTWNWIYTSCNGYRDLIPSSIEFLTIQDDQSDFVAVSFDHIVTLWSTSSDGSTTLHDDLIHCDLSNRVSSLCTLGNGHLLTAQKHALNLWRWERESDSGKWKANCVWSESTIEEILKLEKTHEHALVYMRYVNESTTTNDDESQTIFKIKKFEIANGSGVGGSLTDKVEFSTNSLGYTHFLRVAGASEEEELIYYCDNRAEIRKITMRDETQQCEEAGEASEILWMNRQVMEKSKPQSNISAMLMEKVGGKENDRKGLRIERDTNKESRCISKIANTPAYLMPKINEICVETIESLLCKIE